MSMRALGSGFVRGIKVVGREGEGLSNVLAARDKARVI